MTFKILHLSDLHIASKEDRNQKMLRASLLNYVKESVKKLDAIVFTGDIIDRCDEAAFETGREYIENILNITGLTTNELIVVPGNHDMKRNQAVNRILMPEAIIEDDFYQDNWDYLKVRMQDYSDFVVKLGIAEKESTEAYGYGVKVLEKDGEKICFNLLNSAWSSKGNEDYGNLAIGRWQLEQNRAVLQNIQGKKLVITVMHHPISWMMEQEGKMLQDYIRNEEKFDSRILLHGHIHDVEMEKSENPLGSYISLISGIGYPKAQERTAGQPKIADCRFSVYGIDTEIAQVDCFCLKSIESGKFVPDTTLYNGSENGHYFMRWECGIPTGENNEETEKETSMELDPVPLTSCWTGREEELKLLAHSDTNAIVISGVGGQGKTALAAQFFRNSDKGRTFEKRLWVDCRELSNTMHSKLLQLLEHLTGGKETELAYKDEVLKDTIRRFVNHIKKQKVLVIFDNIDAYVDMKEEELVRELKDLVEMALTEENESLLIMTCRIPIYNSKANFCDIKLDGLKEPEGIAYFKNRGICIEREEDEEACKEIVRITKGHPWWLGLIAGQITTGRMQPKEYLEQNRDEILSNSSQLEQYFGTIWKSLGTNKKGEIAQKSIRYLAEAARPLSVNEMSMLMDENFNQTNKAFKMLVNLNLLIEHDEKESAEKLFQVHPLVREYIHKSYSMEKQKPLVNKLLELFIGKRYYEAIFGEKTSIIIEEPSGCEADNIMAALDTCLNSGNCEDALMLLVHYYQDLLREGYCAEVLYYGRCVLDNIDWRKTEMTTIKARADFICEYLDLLVYHQEGNGRLALNYLKKYEKYCEKNTLPYSGYLGTRANTMWRLGKCRDAEIALKEYEEMQKKHSDVWAVTDMANLKGMILRDNGQVEEALRVFEANSESNARCGNIARCCQLLGQYEEALNRMRECLDGLNHGVELVDRVNKGYAYLWISEIYYEMKKFDKAKIFLILCQENWKEYAPGLLRLTAPMLEKLADFEVDLPLDEGERVLEEFMKN
jgi:predicted phosphodiesterase/tetratricopeptide (TPR) repeat protein